MEFEDSLQRKRRTRLSTDIAASEIGFNVDDETRVPKVGDFMRIDAEWMEVKSKSGRRITVKRGVRGTDAEPHDAGSRISHGETVVREVLVPTYQEDWKL